MARARKGILGTKLGMTQVFDENNRVVPVTVVKAGPNVVTRIRTNEKDGYSAVQLAYGEISPRKVTKPVTGQYAAAGVNPRRHLAELRLDDEAAADPGPEDDAQDHAMPPPGPHRHLGQREAIRVVREGDGQAQRRLHRGDTLIEGRGGDRQMIEHRGHSQTPKAHSAATGVG